MYNTFYKEHPVFFKGLKRDNGLIIKNLSLGTKRISTLKKKRNPPPLWKWPFVLPRVKSTWCESTPPATHWAPWCCALRPVRVARLIRQVEDVASNVVLCGEIGHHPWVVGRGHLQATHGTVSALPTPAEKQRGSLCEQSDAIVTEIHLSFTPKSCHLSMHFWQKLCAQGRMRSAFPSMQMQHSSSSVSCFTLHGHTNREDIQVFITL